MSQNKHVTEKNYRYIWDVSASQAQFLLVLEQVNDNKDNFQRRHATNIIKTRSKLNMILKLRQKKYEERVYISIEISNVRKGN